MDAQTVARGGHIGVAHMIIPRSTTTKGQDPMLDGRGAVVYAINRSAKKAYRRDPGSERWEGVDLKSVAIAAGTERIGSAQIEGRWFALYPVTE